jgi:hypothetical protein
MVTTSQRAEQRLPLNLSRTGAQENIFYRPEGTCHGIINHTRTACHANIIRSKNRTHGHEYELGKHILLSKPQSLGAAF